jgi:hypothetical protein
MSRKATNQPLPWWIMNVLQETLEQAAIEVPKQIILEKLISKKLEKQGISEPKAISRKLARHILSGNSEPFRYNRRKYSKDIDLAFDEADAADIERAFEQFQNELLSQAIPRIAERISKKTLKHLKLRWLEEQVQQEVDLAGFRQRMEERWGKPLGQLRMLLTMAREWCGWAHNRNESLQKDKKQQLRTILVRLLVRGCQVTDEIICLLENGFADGAMARWRTLHEIAVVASVVSQYGEEIAERYIDHQAVESKRALAKYLACYKDLGYKALPTREQRKILKAYDRVLKKYGQEFSTDYGWAAQHLKNKRPTFADLEKAAGRAEMRSYYQMGNDNIHAGIKSMYVRLGLMDYEGLLAGRSNGGLGEPGQNAAHTLTQLSAIVCLSEPILDDLVAGQMMQTLRNEIPQSFNRADKQLRRDDKAHGASQIGANPKT